MTETILIMGGSRFHGLQLAQSLSAAGKKVYVLNRGGYRSQYDQAIQHLIADRNDVKSLNKALDGLIFDAVVDNNAYNAPQVKTLLDILGSRCRHYIFTSTAAVYLSLSSPVELKEQQATGRQKGPFPPQVLSYALDKFRAEEYLRQKCRLINFSIIRIPNIFGRGDFLSKLSFFYYRFQDGGKILLEEEIKRFSLVCVQDVVNMFTAVILNKGCFGKTLNFADPESYSYDQFFALIFADLYRPDSLVLLPSTKMWKTGYFLPFAWGPMINTESFKTLLPDFVYTPLTAWGPKTLDWELQHFKGKLPDAYFLDKRRAELKIIPSIAC